MTFSTQSLTLPREKLTVDVIGEKSKSDSVLDARVRTCEPKKASLTTVPENEARDGGDGTEGAEGAEGSEETPGTVEETAVPAGKPSLVRQRRLADEPAVPRVRSEELPPTARPVRGILKQTSLNENLMRRDWAGERQQIRSKSANSRVSTKTLSMASKRVHRRRQKWAYLPTTVASRCYVTVSVSSARVWRNSRITPSHNLPPLRTAW